MASIEDTRSDSTRDSVSSMDEFGSEKETLSISKDTMKCSEYEDVATASVPIIADKSTRADGDNVDEQRFTAEPSAESANTVDSDKPMVISEGMGLTDVQTKVQSVDATDFSEPCANTADIRTTSPQLKVEESRTDSSLDSDSSTQVENSEAIAATSDYLSMSPDNEDSMQSSEFSSSVSDDPGLSNLPRDVIEEERKFALQTEKESKTNQKITPLGVEEKNKRYKILMSLLGKSKEYANYISKKLKPALGSTEELAKTESESSPVQNSTSRASRKRKGSSRDNDDAADVKRTKVDEYKNEAGLVVSRRQPALLTGGVMRDYQLDGLEWMVALYENGVNGILADEMGLGKTIQVISLLCHLRAKRVYGPHLIIGPLSTLPNWIFEFANFAPDIPVALFHGTEDKRRQIVDQFITCMANKDRRALPIVITSYEMPLRDKKFLSAVKWCSVIVDEGHRLKNYQSRLSQELKRYRTDYRLLLTGTPLQNNLSELWSLLNYLIPEIFDDLDMFENLFDFSDLRTSEDQDRVIQREKEEQLITKMHQILEPFLLRRVKTDVNIALPLKKEILVKAPLTVEQAELYKTVLDKSIVGYEEENEENDEQVLNSGRKKRSCTMNKKYSEDWDIDEDTDYMPTMVALPTTMKKKRLRSSVDENIEYVFNIKLTNPFMMLRKIVNHPYLVKTPVVAGTRDIIVNEKLIQQSGKLLVLDALLPRLKVDGHKVLLFSTFKIMLDLIEDYVLMRGYKYRRLDGSCSIEARLEDIKAFNTDPETFIFLISTRAGGLGINLTAADTVIIYDSDWNPQVDLQAQDRCHRIGQTRPVVVYRLVTAGTIDEHIMTTAVYKRRLEKLVVTKGKFKKKDSEDGLSLADLVEVLESTDFEHVIHPNGLVLSDEEIERLLDRSDLLNESKTESKTPNTPSRKMTPKRKKAARTPKTTRALKN